MSLKVLLPVVAVALLALPSGATSETAPAGVLGVVESTGGYELIHGETSRVVSPSQSRLARVSTGDKIVAGEESAIVRLVDGNAVLIGSESSVEMLSASTVVLEEGTVAVAFTTGSDVAVQFEDLEISSVEFRGEDRIVPMAGAQSAMVGVQQVGPDHLRLSGINQPAFVSTIGSAGAFAVLAANETMDLVRNEAGVWLPAGNPFNLQDGAANGVGGDDGDRRVAGWVVPVAIVGGAVAAGAAGYGIYYYFIRDDSSSSRDRSRPPVSPSFPSAAELAVD